MSERGFPISATLEKPFVSKPRSKQGCPLCAEILDSDSLSTRLSLYRTRTEKVLLEGQSFIVIPDISPLVPGHRLIVTKNHVPSLAELSEPLYDELEEVCRRAMYQIRVSRPDVNNLSVVLFEHGGFAGHRGSGDCINHAHMHLVPLAQSVAAPLPLREWLEEYGDIFEIDTLRDIATAVRTRAKGYLFCQDENGCRLLVPDLRLAVPCQYMRRMLATHLHVREWNWKTVFGRDRGLPRVGVR